MVFDIIVYVLVIGLLVGLFLYKKKKNTPLNGYIIKGVIIALFCVVLIKSFAADGFVAVING